MQLKSFSLGIHYVYNIFCKDYHILSFTAIAIKVQTLQHLSKEGKVFLM